MSNLKFFYNGIKGSDGKLQKAYYGPWSEDDDLVIRAREYTPFTQEVRDEFEVKNNTDYMTDYFETDKIVVLKTHPLYNQVLAAYNKLVAHNKKIRTRK